MSRAGLIVGAALVAATALGGGGWYVFQRDRDPLVRAERLAAQGNLRAAQVELRNSLRSQPNNADAHLRMARLQMKLADPVAAEKEFRAAAGLGAERGEIVPLLGESILVQGRYRDVLAQVPARAADPAIAARNLLLRAVAHLALQDMPAAEATLAEAERVAPGSAETALIGARVAAARNDGPAAQAKVDEVLRRDPNQVEALLMQAKLLTAAGDRTAAAAIASRAVAAAPWSAMARVDRANQFLFAGQDEKAQADVDAVLEAQPRFIDAVYLNGILLARRGKFTEAAVELAKLDPVATRFPQALYYQSLVATNLGQTETATELARRYLTLAPNDPDGVLQLARAELVSKRPANAVQVLERAVAAGQNTPEALDLLGRAYGAVGNRSAATAAFGRAAKLAPDNAEIQVNLGLAQLQEGKANDALFTLEPAFLADPRQPSAGEAVVSAALGAGDIDKADAALARLRAQAGNTEGVGILTGLVRLGRGDLDGARQALSETLRAYPASAVAKYHLARVSVRQGRRAEGLNALREVLAKDPANMQVLTTYLFLLAEDNQLPPAIQALEAARKANPQNPALAGMLADALTSIGSADRAVTLIESLRRGDDPLSPPLLASLGRAQAAAGSLRDAKATYRRLLTVQPGNTIVRGLLIDLLRRDKEFDGIRATLQDALTAAPPESPLQFGLLRALVDNEGEWKGPEAALKMAVELRQQPAAMPAASVLRGDVLMRTRGPAEAAQAYLAELRAAPSAVLLMRMVAALSAAGQDDMAARELRSWLVQNPGMPEAAQALAQLDIRAKRFADAQKNLALVLEKRPDDAQALNNLAWVYQQMGDKRARATAQRAYLQAPTPLAADTLGWIMVQDGAPKAAVPLLQRASEQLPRDASIRWHLAVALKDDGRTDEAAATLRPILDGADPFDDRPAARALLDQLTRRN